MWIAYMICLYLIISLVIALWSCIDSLNRGTSTTIGELFLTFIFAYIIGIPVFLVLTISTIFMVKVYKWW